MKSTIVIVLFIILSCSVFLCGQKNELGSVIFSWDKAGDVTLIVRYKGEELQPLGGLHFHVGGYEGSRAQAQLRKVTHVGQLFAANCYRSNKVKFNWWEYFKSFFWKAECIGRQKLVLFNDGYDSYEGCKGTIGYMFKKEARKILKEFETLQRLRAIST